VISVMILATALRHNPMVPAIIIAVLVVIVVGSALLIDYAHRRH
jgi:hypothetical protein